MWDWIEACNDIGLVESNHDPDRKGKYVMFMKAMGLSDSEYWKTTHTTRRGTGRWKETRIITAQHNPYDNSYENVLAAAYVASEEGEEGKRSHTFNISLHHSTSGMYDTHRKLDLKREADAAGAHGRVYCVDHVSGQDAVVKVIDPNQLTWNPYALNEVAMQVLAHMMAPDHVPRPIKLLSLERHGAALLMLSAGTSLDRVMKNHTVAFAGMNKNAQTTYWGTVLVQLAQALQCLNTDHIRLVHADMFHRNVCVRVASDGRVDSEDPHVQLIDFGQSSAIIGPKGDARQQYMVGTCQWLRPASCTHLPSVGVVPFVVGVLLTSSIYSSGAYKVPARVVDCMAAAIGVTVKVLLDIVATLRRSIRGGHDADWCRTVCVFGDYPDCSPETLLVNALRLKV